MGDTYATALNDIVQVFLEKNVISLQNDVFPIMLAHIRFSFMDDIAIHNILDSLIRECLEQVQERMNLKFMCIPRFGRGQDPSNIYMVDVEYHRYK